MAVNYEDERFDKVEDDKQAELDEWNQTYSGIIDQSDKYFQDQITAVEDSAAKQTQLQNEQTDFTIKQIEQQKEQAQKDYTKEQSGAYADWQKQSNQYGVEAEKMASAGLAGTGFSESSQVSMYNTYQNRVATARESYNKAVQNYDNAIKDAQLQNSVALAEIASQSLQQQLELSLQGFQYKNQLILDQADRKAQINDRYYNRYLDTLNQINTENTLAEQQRQFNQNYDQTVKEFDEGIRQFEEEIARLKKKDAQEYELQIQELELKKEQEEEAKRQFNEEMQLKREQLEYERELLERQYIDKEDGGKEPKEEPTVFNLSMFNESSLAKLGIDKASELEDLLEQGKVRIVQIGTQYYVEAANGFTGLKSFSAENGSNPKETSVNLPGFNAESLAAYGITNIDELARLKAQGLVRIVNKGGELFVERINPANAAAGAANKFDVNKLSNYVTGGKSTTTGTTGLPKYLTG